MDGTAESYGRLTGGGGDSYDHHQEFGVVGWFLSRTAPIACWVGCVSEAKLEPVAALTPLRICDDASHIYKPTLRTVP